MSVDIKNTTETITPGFEYFEKTIAPKPLSRAKVKELERMLKDIENSISEGRISDAQAYTQKASLYLKEVLNEK